MQPCVQAETARTEYDDLEQPARDGDVLKEVEELVLIPHVVVEEDRSRQAVDCDQGGYPARPITQYECRHPNGFHRGTDHETELRERQSH